MTPTGLTYDLSPPLDDAELDALHAAAFGGSPLGAPWRERLERHSLFWIAATLNGDLVGFVNVIGDGGVHAFLLDTCVAPDLQGRGIGASLVRRAAAEARRRGCHWLHADYEPHLVEFYERGCGMRPTAAGLLRLI
ncbi:GNAT family N-acetyltransferase [Propioniciclava coleopterorum]|uniref:GNAT family N-acetyltransferase n=1 Tax=Propioniciclava coleopterorum TaxID=2714937 RepID=UPI001FE5A524|nr:GNAT family N-acetyltransferase [Propioniciclava coleopterorum]